MAATERVMNANVSSIQQEQGANNDQAANPNVKIISKFSETTSFPSLRIRINLNNLRTKESGASALGNIDSIPSTNQNINQDEGNINQDKAGVEQEPESDTETDINDENAFSDSMDVSQLDAIVDQGHKILESTNSMNTQNLGLEKISSVSNKRSGLMQVAVERDGKEGKLMVTLKFPEIAKFIHGSKGWGVSARKLSHMNYATLEHKARLLVVSVNMLLETTKLPESSRKILERVHNCFLKQLPTMTLDKVRTFVLRLHGYLMSLRNVIEGKEEMDIEKSIRESASLMEEPTVGREKQVAAKEVEKRMSAKEAGKQNASTQKAAKPKKAVKETKKTAKKKKVTKRRKRKPKLPYARYHFPIPVDDMTTFGGLRNAFNDDEDEDDDDELVEESMVMSLLDPISGSRLVTPLRTRFCSHVGCFDMASFLALNKLRPFKVGIRRERPLPSGEPNVAAIFRDTRRRPINPDSHNQKTTEFDYKLRCKKNKDAGKYNNDLEFFKCPICRIEFSIKVPGDVYVVGELVDLLFSMDQDGHEKAEKVEISRDGNWVPLEEEPEEVKIQKSNSVVEINLDDETSDEEGEDGKRVKKEMPSEENRETNAGGQIRMNKPLSNCQLSNCQLSNGQLSNGQLNPDQLHSDQSHSDQLPSDQQPPNSLGGTAIMSSDTEDSWDAEFQELDRVMGEDFWAEGIHRLRASGWRKMDGTESDAEMQNAAYEMHVGVKKLLNALQGDDGRAVQDNTALPQRRVGPPPPPSQYQGQFRNSIGRISADAGQSRFPGYSQPPMYSNRRNTGENGAVFLRNLRRTATYGPPGGAAGNNGNTEPVFFTGNGEEDDPFVID
ncbi:hypothetical protein BRETT_002816 [Brettanomyces bruxellensis]|uniref:SP-RING-type domain-containing protein n=1 Tax=Dekkera bruxellensis TaxID=5007 RepID=A0A871RDI5_DEKBR|nr:uncharacterized protein BRETT_002816 [Brettanomyces bruxellensis]QOU22634.1 hypothetical protein BRETT_002816 [Brettanomyces bruxellensis]